jgi:hypothetical protein
MVYAGNVSGRSRSGSLLSVGSSSVFVKSPLASPRKMSLPSPNEPNGYPPRSPPVSRQAKPWRISVAGPTPHKSPASPNTSMRQMYPTSQLSAHFILSLLLTHSHHRIRHITSSSPFLRFLFHHILANLYDREFGLNVLDSFSTCLSLVQTSPTAAFQSLR